MARSSRYTLLSLDRFAQLLGLNPVHFNGAAGSTVWPDNGEAQDIWYQYPWQLKTETLSREELAIAIYNAEQDIRAVLGYSVAPEWIANEKHTYPQHFRKTIYGANSFNVRHAGKSITTRYSKLISPGRRAIQEVILNQLVSYSDVDGDGFKELATVTCSTDYEPKELHIYFHNKNGDRTWEIRPLLSATSSGGTATLTANSWLFLDPNKWEHQPTTTEPEPIDINLTNSYVTTVDIYREYTDTTQVSAQFIWEPSPDNNQDTANTTQNGLLLVRDSDVGIVVPRPASYSSGWSISDWSVSRDPDQVNVWYQAGNQSDDYLNGYAISPLDDYLATAIMWLATARLDKPITGDGLVGNRVVGLQRDMTQNSREKFFVLNIQSDVFTNPFGTLAGEYRAWQRISKLIPDYNTMGGVL